MDDKRRGALENQVEAGMQAGLAGRQECNWADGHVRR